MPARMSMDVFKEEVAADVASKGRKLTAAEKASRLASIQRRRVLGEFADRDLADPLSDEERDTMIGHAREDAAAAFIMAVEVDNRLRANQKLLVAVLVVAAIILWRVW